MLGSGAGTGTGSIQDFMSPFQQQVIDTTLGEFDRQRQIQEQAIKDQQAQLGVLGAGRAGVQRSEFVVKLQDKELYYKQDYNNKVFKTLLQEDNKI